MNAVHYTIIDLPLPTGNIIIAVCRLGVFKIDFGCNNKNLIQYSAKYFPNCDVKFSPFHKLSSAQNRKTNYFNDSYSNQTQYSFFNKKDDIFTLMERYADKYKYPDNEKFQLEILYMAALQIIRYFKKEITSFTVPIVSIGTEFQIKTWKALLTIPYGETRTYAEVAHMIRNSKAARAVGNSNNKNMIPIIIPCHRVIGSDNSLVGFASGLEIKKYLLNLENNDVFK